MPGRAQANEVIKGKLYQRGQFLTWPYEQKREMLKRYGIDVVVNLWSKVDPDLSGGGVIYINWETSPSDLPRDADLMVNYLMRLIQDGHCALIHCEAGRGRSVWLTTRVLAALGGIGNDEALQQIRGGLIPSDSLKGELLEDLKNG